MALTHVTTIRNGLADLVVDAIDAGAGAGAVVIATSGFASTLVTITLADPAFGAASAGVATAASLPKEGTAGATGTAAVFKVQDSNAAEVFQGTVTATGGGGDMELSSVSITATDVVRINTFTYTAPQ